MIRALTGPGLYVGAAALAIGTLVAGCGSSGTATGGASSTAGGSTAVGSSPAASSPAPSSSASTVGISLTGRFCADARTEDAHSQQLETDFSGTSSPAALKSLAQSSIGILDAFESEAPAQIKPSVTILVNADKQLFSALDQVGYDYTKVSPTTLSSLDTPSFLAAAKTVASYLETTCHIAPPS